MDTGTIVLSAGAMGMLLLEGIKWLWRLFVVKDSTFDFPIKFYAFMLPVMTFLSEPLLALLAVGGYVWPTNVSEWVQKLVLVVLSSLIGLVTYNAGLKPLKEYARSLK